MLKRIVVAAIAVAVAGMAISANAGSRTCYTNCFGNSCTTTCY